MTGVRTNERASALSVARTRFGFSALMATVRETKGCFFVFCFVFSDSIFISVV